MTAQSIKSVPDLELDSKPDHNKDDKPDFKSNVNTDLQQLQRITEMLKEIVDRNQHIQAELYENHPDVSDIYQDLVNKIDTLTECQISVQTQINDAVNALRSNSMLN